MNWQAFWIRKTPLNYLLLPLSWLFGAAVALRCWLYRRGWLYSGHPGVPVIVVGNLNAGGSGKTPFVIWLVQWLQGQGYRPGVVSRGYGRRDRKVRCVMAGSTAEEAGDEPLLVHLKTGVPVAVAGDRVEAARLLLARYPGVDVIVSDDGLQHYRLRRDLELVLADGANGFGNGWLLPAGPLREPVSRLSEADALILSVRNGEVARVPGVGRVFSVTHQPAGFRNLADGREVSTLPGVPDKPVLAVTGIARPDNFFRMLSALGIRHQRKVFPDHYQYREGDIEPSATVVMTEKDAVKCGPFAGAEWWVLELKVAAEAKLIEWLAAKLPPS